MDLQEKKNLSELVEFLKDATNINEKNILINKLLIRDNNVKVSVTMYKALTALRYAINSPGIFSNSLIRKLIFCEDGQFLIGLLSQFIKS